MPQSNIGLFIVWRIFQRRAESLAAKFDLSVKYYYFSWEEKTKLHKALSYIFKTVLTLRDMFRLKPSIIFIQLPPTPVLYIAIAFCKLTNCKLVADCHNAMIYSKWLSWPLAKLLLREADTLLVHNQDVENYAKRFQLDAITLHDPLPALTDRVGPDIRIQYEFTKEDYVIVPWSFAPDEPIDELIRAAASMPETVFVMTWFAEKLPANIKNNVPSNLVMTGYLNDNDFTAIFAQATAALVLTTREGTQPSGATEAIALSVPLILSDLKTTRRLYDDMPIYIDNSADGIRRGIQQAFTEQDEVKARVLAFKNLLSMRLEAEIEDVKSLLRIPDPPARITR
ncbi:hypothetical protein ACFL3A_09915 [Pseudomonadota bacterium]